MKRDGLHYSGDEIELCESLAVVLGTTCTCGLPRHHQGPHIDTFTDPDGDPATIIVTWEGDYSDA